MKQLLSSEEQNQFDANAPKKIKAAHVFNNQVTDDPLQNNVKPAIIVSDADIFELSDEPIDDEQTLGGEGQKTSKKTSKKWFLLMCLAILLASSVELVFFIITLVDQMDWLAGVWLVIFSVFGIRILRQVFVEFTGLKLLKSQEDIRNQSEQIANTSVIGLAEQHCMKVAKSLPNDYQYLVESWRDSFNSHHCDSEVLCLFEYHVLAPIDKVAIKQVSKNASAATVMCSVEPALGVTAKVYCVPPDKAVKPLAMPPSTSMSLAAKSSLALLKVKVNVTSPDAVPTELSVMATVGGAVSKA